MPEIEVSYCEDRTTDVSYSKPIAGSMKIQVRARAHALIAAMGCLAFLYPPADLLAQSGQTGLSFLKLGVGARSVAMGEAYAAIGSDASATYYNPGGLAEANKTSILLMHKEWIQDVRTEFLGVNIPFEDFALGIGINTTNVGDIQLRTQPGPSEGTFSSHDFAGSVSIARRIIPELSFGASLKFLYEKIFVDEASGVGFDFGALYNSPVEGLRFAVVGSNFGSMGSLKSDNIQLPSLLRIGSAYVRQLDGLRSAMTVGADVVKVFRENNTHLHTGAEVNYQETIAFRLGYLFGYETRGLTAGLGLRRDIFRLDYGFSPQSQDLNSGHTLSVEVEF
jgi:hypothetical protein